MEDGLRKGNGASSFVLIASYITKLWESRQYGIGIKTQINGTD